MNELFAYRLRSVSVLDLVGADATAILHNLTTNEIKNLSVDQGCESFVTDVRGKTLGHVFVYRIENGFRMIGAADQSEGLATHADRYTIREDAVPQTRDMDFVALALSADHFASLLAAIDQTGSSEPAASAKSGAPKRCITIEAINCLAYQTDWLGAGAWVLLPEVSDEAKCSELLQQHGFEIRDDGSFHQQRILAGFPWYGIDLSEKNLPQEADRNHQTISFTKGCYLGQETVARLDALGQVQKQLVRWAISDCVPSEGTELVAEGKTVGKLSSVAKLFDDGAIAIGMARRSHFEPGSAATGELPGTGQVFQATVQPIPKN